MHDRFRAAGAPASQQLVAVGVEETDTLERNPEPRAEYLRERRGVALSVIQRPGDDDNRTVSFEADAAHFLAGRRGDFEKVAHPEAAHLSALAALAFAPREA